MPAAARTTGSGPVPDKDRPSMSPVAVPSTDHLLALNGPSIDGSWYRGVTGFAQHTHWLQPIVAAYDVGGIVLLCGLLVLAWWNARRRGDLAAIVGIAWAGIGTVLCVAAGLTIKQLVAETRPCLALGHITTVQPCPGPGDYSFPSDHTTLAAALAAGLWIAARRLGLIAAVLALLEGFSRVYLGQHYPHDVAAGLALSAIIVLAGWPLARRPLTTLIHLLTRTFLRPVITNGADRRGTATGAYAPASAGGLVRDESRVESAPWPANEADK